MISNRNLALVAVLGLGAPPAAIASPILSDFNLFVGGNLNSVTEVEGRTMVRGSILNAPGSGSSNYATALIPPGNYTGVNTLIVGGNINVPGNHLNVNAGSVLVGGSVLAGNVNLNGGGTLSQNNSAAMNIANAALAEMLASSAYFGGLTTNSTIVNPAGPSAVTFIATPGPDNIAVFNVDSALLSDPDSQQYDLILGPGVTPHTTYVFNVSGTNVAFNQGNFVGTFTNAALRAFIIWNFAEATNISLTNQWFGALLAPNADLTNFTAMEGSVFVGGNFTQRGEVHLPNFNGPLQDPADPAAPAPEPGSLALAGLIVPVLLAAVWLRRRRAPSLVPG